MNMCGLPICRYVLEHASSLHNSEVLCHVAHLSDVHAGSAGRKSDVDAVVDDDRHASGPAHVHDLLDLRYTRDPLDRGDATAAPLQPQPGLRQLRCVQWLEYPGLCQVLTHAVHPVSEDECRTNGAIAGQHAPGPGKTRHPRLSP